MSDDVIADFARQQQRRRAGGNVATVTGINPERAARAQRLGQRLGVPAQAVLADPGYEVQARQVEIASVLDRSPATSSFMADEANAEIAHDQVEGLGSLEQMLRRGVRGGADVLGNIGKSLYAGIPRTSAGVVGLTEALGDVAGALNPFAAAERGLTAAGVLRGPTSEQNRRQTSQAYRQRLMSQAAALRPQTDNALAGAAYSGLESVVPSILGIAATLASGGSATPAALLLAAPVGGEAYGQARDAGRGIAPSLLYGAGQGGAEAVGERIGLGPLFDGLKVGSPFLQTLIRTQVSEQLGEQATTVLQDFNEWVTLNPDKTVNQFLAERPNAALQTAIATAVGSAATTSGVYAGNRATQQLLTYADNRANAQASKVRAEQFNEAADAVVGNPVRERSPERFEQFLKAAGGDEQVFVPAEQVASFFQSNPELDQWLDEWDIRDQVNAALVSGADVVFDQSTYLGKIAGTPAHEAWKNEIRHGLDALSIREADEFEANGEESLRASFDAAVSVAETEAAALAPEARVAEDLFSQLRSAGYTADAARTQATLAARAFARRAERSPQRFGDAYAAYQDAGLTVQQEFPQVIRENLDRIDVMIEALRKGKAAPSEQRMFGRSLMEFLSQEGGVIDTGGELAALGADTWHRPKQGGRAFRRRFIRSQEQGGNAYAPDQAALRAVEAGYLPEGATGNDLFEAVREELAGRPAYSQGFERDTAAITNAANLNELEQLIAQLDGVTLESTNAEIKAALERAAEAAPGYEGAETYDQSGRLITDSEAFRAWFGDSKVVDESGQPLVVYHGTPTDFEAFDRDRVGGRWDVSFGFHFSDRADEASIYAGSELGSTDGQVLPVYLKLENPLEIETGLEAWRKADDDRGEIIRAVVESRRAAARDNPEARRAADAALFEGLGLEAPPRNYDPLKAYDGVIIRGRDGVNVIAFDPTQIKSVFNRGTFDPADPRILYQSEVSGLTEDQYIERINPEGRRIAEGDRPNLGMGDMYGMAPKGARQIATMQDTELGRVRIVESGGDVYALANNPDLGEEDVVGYMIDRDGSTELAVVSEAQGKGIGAELSYQFRSRSPFAQSGGLTEAGEATARAAYRRMTREGRTLYQFAGEGAQTAPLAELARAKEMEAAGEMSDDIWETTGWGKGDDGKWRFEISDADAKMRPGVVERSSQLAMQGQNTMPLSEVMEHDALFAAYPALAAVPVAIMDLPGSASGAVARDENGRIIVLMSGEAIEKRPEAAEAILIHEVQHLIQHVEGFAIGASSDPDNLRAAGYGDALAEMTEESGADWERLQNERRAAMKVYRRSSGEIEARNTEKRRSMNDEERLYFPPNYTRDIKSSEAIVRFDNGGGQSLAISESVLRQNTPFTGPRGQISFTNGQAAIRLFESRDLSTFTHEFGHLTLEMMIDDAADPNASAEVKADMQTVLDWFSREAGQTITVDDIGVDQHELWARGSERYLMEGKAPSIALRDVFRTFATWLKSIYRTVLNLNAPISDDVRAVMARLLASDAEIEQARQVMGVEAGFETAEQAGMSGAEFEAYQNRVNRARADAEDSVVERVTRAIRRRVTAEWRTAQDELRPDVTAEVDAMPDVMAIDWLVTSKQGLTRETVVAMLGDEAGLAMLPKRVPPIVRDNGMHPDEVAEIVGYRNGHELLNALMDYEAEKRALVAGGDKRSVRQARIDRLLMERMLDRYGDPLNDGSIEREALDALHSDRRSEILAAELGVLARRSGNNPSPLSAIRDWARGLVGGRPVREARSGKYLRAERTAANAVQKALAAGDRQEAFKQKQAQTLNAVLFSEASRAERYVDGAVARLKRLSGRVLSIDVDYRDQIETLLEQYDLREVSGRQVQRRRSLLQFVKEREEAGEPVNVPPELLAAANKTHYSELTVDEFRALDEAVQHLAHLGRLKRKLIVNGEQRDLDRMADEAWTVAQALPDVKGAAIAGSATSWQKAVRVGAQFEASLVKAQEFFRLLDGGAQDGVYATVLDKPGQEAAARKVELSEMVWRQVIEAERAIPNSVKNTWTDTLEGHPLRNPQTGEPVELKRRDLIGLARHTGTMSNFETMSKGWGIVAQDADAFAVAGARDAFIGWLDGQMDATEWLYVQAQWDASERLRPLYFAAARKVEGFEPDAVEAAPLPVTSAGPLKGGYAPISYHPDYDANAQKREQRDAASIFGDVMASGPRPDNGATKSRTGYVGPVKIALEDARYAIEKQLTYTAYAEYVTNSLKFLRHPLVRQAMIAKLGVEAYNTFEPWIAGQVRDESVVDPSAHPMVKIARQARSNMTAAVLLGSFTVLAAQPGGLAQSIVQNGPVRMAKAVGNAIRLAAGRNLYPYVTGLSDFMRLRVEQGDLDRDYRLAMQRAQGAEGLKERALVMSGKAIALVDFYFVSAPTWLAAYDRALTEGKDEAGAVYLADKAVRITQGGGRAIDQSGIMRANEVTKMVTFAYGWANALYNMQRAPLADMQNGHDRVHNAIRLMAVLVLPALFDAVLSGDTPDAGDDPEEAIKNAVGWFARNVFFGSFSGIPVVRDVAGGAERLAQGKYVGSLGQTAMGRIADSVLALGVDAWAAVDDEREVNRRWPAHVINATGLALGLPGTTQVARTTNYVQDVRDGEQNPDSVLDWMTGLLKGPQKDQE